MHPFIHVRDYDLFDRLFLILRSKHKATDLKAACPPKMTMESTDILADESLQKQIRDNKQRPDWVEKIAAVYGMRKRLQGMVAVIGLVKLDIAVKELSYAL